MDIRDGESEMDIRHLKTLRAVVETGSFVAAGQKLGLSQSSVSLQIKSLEDELGVYLFDRSSRPPTPSARGRILAEQSEDIIELLEEAKRNATDCLVRGKLTIGAVYTALSSFMPAALKSLRRAHPQLRLDVKSGSSADLAGKLLQGELDIVICTKPDNVHQGLVWHDIAKEPFAVIAPIHALGETDVDLLTSNPFIWFNRNTWAGRNIEQELNRRKINVDGNMEIDTLDAISSLVSAGLGVSVVPVCRGARPFPSRLRSVPFGEPVFCRYMGALVHSRPVLSPQLSALLQTLKND